MIGRKTPRMTEEEEVVELKRFDDFELRLGDMMRGERATLGKSLLDVQRELRIKAAYIAAIENADPSAFDTPGFISGYVRSYARYLNMDPEAVFDAFCAESGFTVAHGLSAQASGSRPLPTADRAIVGRRGGRGADNNPFTSPNTPFVPVSEGMFGGLLGGLEPRAIGSSLVLLALIAGIGYGAWAVLKEVQQVQVVPVDQTPVVLSDLGPQADRDSGNGSGRLRAEALDRLYRPQALAVPVMVARDAPISTLDPQSVGTFRPETLPQVQISAAQRVEEVVPQVVEAPAQQLRMVAVRPSWVRVSAADGTVIFEGIMESGQSYDVPLTEEPPTLRAGESGAVYFALGEQHYGPVGPRGTVTKNVPLSIEAVTERFEVADLERDRDLARMVAELETTPPQE